MSARMLLLLCLLAPGLAAAEPPEQMFARANDLLAAGKPAEALPLYEQLARTTHHGLVWFNAGNCQWQLNRPVWARVAYLRADKWHPGTPAVARNLSLLRRRFPTPNDPGPEGGWIAFFRELRGPLPPWLPAAILLATAWLATLLAWGLLHRRGRLWLYGLLLALGIALAAGAVLGLEQSAVTRITRGVVLHPDTDLLAAPEEGATVLFTVPAGQEVRWVERRGDWISVAASAQVAGWTPVENVAGI